MCYDIRRVNHTAHSNDEIVRGEMRMTLHYTVTAADSGKKLFSILRGRMRLSAGLIKRLKFQTQIYVNGVPVHTDYIVAPGDIITLPLPPESADFPPEPGPLQILYEDEAIIAIHKPAGMIIHPSATRNTGTLANRLLAYFGGGTIHPLNRLDRDTTGVTVFAKNGYVKGILTLDLEKAKIHKTYLAPTFGALPRKQGVIDLPIDRVNNSSLWRTIREEGQPARTAYELLESHGLWNLYAFHPLTGRTHQIRLHAFSSGAPLLGDPIYATEESRAFSNTLGLTVQQLCCTEMRFSHPLTREALAIQTTPEFFSEPWYR